MAVIIDEKNKMFHLRTKNTSYIFAFVKDDVLLYPGFTGSQLKKAVADYLYYDINKNLVTSKSTVTIYGQGIKTTGTDFSLDLNKNVMSYKGQPNATYYPNSK